VTLIADLFRFNLVQTPVNILESTFSLENVDFVLSSSYPTSTCEQDIMPLHTSLAQNYPNPFNPTTTIRFTIGRVVAPSASEGPAAVHVRLVVYDVLGREVAVLVNDLVESGNHSVTWNASGRASGVYFYRVTTGTVTQIRTMVLLK
jgi:hypothetical protein